MRQPGRQVCRACRRGGCPAVRRRVQVVGGPRAGASGGLTYELVGWRTGFRGANPPARTSTHEMGRSEPVRADPQRAGGESVRWNRCRGTGSSGLGQGITCPNPPRPVSAHHDLSQPTTTCPRSPDVDRSAQQKPAATTRPSLGTPSTLPIPTSPPVPTSTPADDHPHIEQESRKIAIRSPRSPRGARASLRRDCCSETLSRLARDGR